LYFDCVLLQCELTCGTSIQTEALGADGNKATAVCCGKEIHCLLDAQ